MPPARAQALDAHYGRPDLWQAILAGLRAAGKDPEALTPDDLAPVDEFHTRGRQATLELADLVGIRRDERVLDVGGGLGGPARTLARAFGCHVTILDLTEEYCRVGEELTRRAGLADRLRFRHGDALHMPFDEGTFDVIWTHHSSMNVEDKGQLYREAHRVLRPAGRLALHEIMAGARSPIHFPVPWARDPGASFLGDPEAIRALLGAVGFEELTWADVSAPAVAWFRERLARAVAAPPPLGLHLLLGEDFGVMFANQARNLEEDRIRVIQAVCRRR
jgi:SAM-dependent methyltransferase